MTTDFHTHAFPDGLAPKAIEVLNSEIPRDSWAVLDGTIGDLLRSMDRAGIDRSVICSIATAPKQVEPIINWSLSIASDHIVPFGSVHPGCADMAEAARKIADAGLKGLKLHPHYQEFAIDERRMWPLYEAVEALGLIMVFHAGCDIAFPPEDDRAAPRRILTVHRAFPQIPIVAAHLGGWKMWDEVAETLAGTDVYLGTSYTFNMDSRDAVERVLDRHSRERILFGTDSPWVDQKLTLDLVRQAFPDDETREMVLATNARRLLGLGDEAARRGTVAR